MLVSRNFAIVSDEYKITDSLKGILKRKFLSPKVDTYRFDDFTPPKYGTDFNRDKPIVIIVASSILDYAREVNIIRRLRICRDLDEDARKVPVFLLTYEDHLGIIKRYPDGILLLSEGCTIIQIPFKIDYLKIKIETAKGVKDFDSLRDFLHIESRLIQIEKQDKHRMANLLGPQRLLKGACLSGEFGVGGEAKEKYKIVQVNLTNLRETQFSEDYYNEYLDLQELSSFDIEDVESEEKIKQKGTRLCDEFKGIRVLYIDDEHKNGWSEVLKELLIPSSGVWYRNELDILIARDDFSKTEFCCIDKLEKAKELLKLHDRKGWIHYDLILLDLRLNKESPDMPINETSGYFLLKAIREKDPTVPVIMFTASEKAVTLRTLQELGISGYFIKELPGGGGNFSRQNFYVYKQAMINAIIKYYLRDIWFYTITFIEGYCSRLTRQGKYINLLKPAYFLVRNENIYNRTKFYDYYNYNMAIYLYYECLDEYVTHEINKNLKKEDGMAIKLKNLSAPYQRIAFDLKNLRDDIVHKGHQANIPETVKAFLSIIYILSNGSLPCEVKYSRGFDEFLKVFSDTINRKKAQYKNGVKR